MQFQADIRVISRDYTYLDASYENGYTTNHIETETVSGYMYNVVCLVRLIGFSRANWHNKGQIE